MRIGYACQTIGVPNTNQKNCIMKNASEAKLNELISHNLSSLENIIDYNINNNIRLFRISSDLIPFGSSLVNTLKWKEIFLSEFSKIGKKIQTENIRVSMHPGQYTVLNSPNSDVVKKAIDDLNYHADVLDSFNTGNDCKIVLHIGGIYNDKIQAVKSFKSNYHNLDSKIKNRLVIENDDKLYNISDLLEIGTSLNIPVVFDNLHNKLHPSDKQKSELYWISECKKTWHENDGCQKIHYSQQDKDKRHGSHSISVDINEFMELYKNLERQNIDIMLEVKDKNLSAVKCINSTSADKNITALELEWNRYKYKILENSPCIYSEIPKLLVNKNSYPVIAFYNLIEASMKTKSTIENSINAAQHIWAYFEEISSEKEKSSFIKNIQLYRQGKVSLSSIKNSLFKMAVKYNQANLIDSYYFIL